MDDVTTIGRFTVINRDGFWYIVRPDGTNLPSGGRERFETKNIAMAIAEYVQSTKQKAPVDPETHKTRPGQHNERDDRTACLRREHRRAIGEIYGLKWSQNRGFYYDPAEDK